MNRKYVSILSGAAGILLAGAVYSQVLKFPSYAIHATQYVKFLLTVMTVLCALLLVSSFFSRDTSKPSWVKAPLLFTVTVVLTVLNVVAMQYVGFYISSAVYMLVLAFCLGLRRPLMLILCTVLLLALVYGVFVRFLGVPVPLGIFDEFTFSDIAGSLAKARLAWSAL